MAAPSVYSAEDVDETAMCVLAALAEARQRLCAHYGGDTRSTICRILDEYATEIVNDEEWP